MAGSSYAGAVSMGTSIIAVTFNGGVILGADSRTSTGSYIANRVADKVGPCMKELTNYKMPLILDSFIRSHRCQKRSMS